MLSAPDTRTLLANTGGLLLAGGRARRFGAEKALAMFRGVALMDQVARVFAPCAAFAVSAREGTATEQHARGLGADILEDDPRHPSGPLAGVCAGLAWGKARGFDRLAIAPCDAPLLPHDLFARLIAGMGDARAAFAMTSDGEHPLCAVLRVEVLAPLADALDKCLHPPVRDFLAALGAIRVPFDDAAAFANANTLQDLAQLERCG